MIYIFNLQPKQDVPKASLLCVGTLFITSMFVLFIVPSVPSSNEIVAQAAVPFNNGFRRMFNIDEKLAIAFSIPATYATAYGFVNAGGRVVISMARSGLFPKIFREQYGKYRTPYIALLLSGAIGYALCILVFFFPIVNLYLFNICMSSAFFAYIAQLVGYIVFRLKYSPHEKHFKSPLGVFGAVYGILVFTLAFIGVIGYQNDNYVAIISFTIMLTSYTVYYLIYAKKRQTFSSEEKSIFLFVHIIKCKLSESFIYYLIY